jgi:hypothetical protein
MPHRRGRGTHQRLHCPPYRRERSLAQWLTTSFSNQADDLRVPVVDRKQLNEIEATNVAEGRAWALRSRKDHLTDDYVRELHEHMSIPTATVTSPARCSPSAARAAGWACCPIRRES